MFPKPSQLDFKLSSGQELLHFVWLYIKPLLAFPHAPWCVCAHMCAAPPPRTAPPAAHTDTLT